MKCISCNNEIPDASLVCPFCNKKVEPSVKAAPVFNVDNSNTPVPPGETVVPSGEATAMVNPSTSGETINNNVSPVSDTPVVPNINAGDFSASGVPTNDSVVAANQAVPANNQMGIQEEQNSQNIANQNVAPVAPVSPQPLETASVPVNPVNVPPQVYDAQASGNVTEVPQVNPVNQAPTEANVMPAQGTIANGTSLPNEVATSNQAPVSQTNVAAASVNPQSNNSLINNIDNAPFIGPSGEAVKLDNVLPPEPKKKIDKKKLIIIIAVVLVVAIIGVLGYLFYSSQYKSANKRIDAVVQALTKETKNIKNDTVTKASGSYTLDASVSYGNNNMGGKVTGTYARDLSSEALDFTFNLESLVMGEELISTPLNVELYYNDSKIYLLLQNFYDNYIYEEYDGLADTFTSLEQNSVNYTTLINGLKNAFAAGIKRVSNTQSVGNATIHGTTKRVNIIKINFNERNQELFRKSFFSSLANNKNFVSEMAKLAGSDEESIKSQLIEVVNKETSTTETKTTMNIEIYTGMFKDVLEGINISGSTTDGTRQVLEIYPISNGYGLTFKSGSQNILEGTYTKGTKTTSVTKETTYKLDFTVYIQNQAYKVSLNFENIADVNTKDARVNVKNSINRKYLTEETKQNILTQASQFGKIGLYLPSILEPILGDTATEPIEEEIPLGSSEDCGSAVSCDYDSINDVYVCQSAITNTQIRCILN